MTVHSSMHQLPPPPPKLTTVIKLNIDIKALCHYKSTLIVKYIGCPSKSKVCIWGVGVGEVRDKARHTKKKKKGGGVGKLSLNSTSQS